MQEAKSIFKALAEPGYVIQVPVATLLRPGLSGDARVLLALLEGTDKIERVDITFVANLLYCGQTHALSVVRELEHLGHLVSEGGVGARRYVA